MSNMEPEKLIRKFLGSPRTLVTYLLNAYQATLRSIAVIL